MTDSNIGAHLDDIREGNACLLSVMGQHYLVEILEVTEDTVRVTFPGSDYPIEGMLVSFEFHDKFGFTSYRTQVTRGPIPNQKGIVLAFPAGCTRSVHRESCRVPTDLTVQVKVEGHPRRFDADLINLSAGGALLRTMAPVDFDTVIEVTMSLPGEPTHVVRGSVAHIAEAGRPETRTSRLVGVQFVGMDARAVQSCTRYIWHRLPQLYPGE